MDELAKIRTCKRSVDAPMDDTPVNVKVFSPVPVCAAEVAKVATTAQLEFTRTS